MGGRIVIDGGNDHQVELLRSALESRGYATDIASGQREACDVVIAMGEDALRVCRDVADTTPVVIIDPAPDVARTVAALRAGAADYVTDPTNFDAIEGALHRVLERRALGERLGSLRAPSSSGDESEVVLLGESPPMRLVRATLERLSGSDATVLITGESGTGKEVVARALHRSGRRRDGPFVAVSCAALPAHLVESEFFGHVRGAFTDAGGARPGLLVDASGGSLFLDEISAMPLPTQAKLLRAIQQRAVRPLGQAAEIPFDARIIAASNVDLERAVRAGAFREDLYFRLNVVQIRLPPLRERELDTLLLGQHFIQRFARASGKRVVGMTSGAARALLSYSWPGNVRELQNWIEAAVALAHHDHITESELSCNLRPSTQPDRPLPQDEGLASWDSLEARHIATVLEEAQGNKAHAARLLGIDRKTLYRKLRRYGVPTSSA